METEIRLPQFGMGMSEAEVLQWLVEDGERVDEGQDIVDVEAEKAQATLVAPAGGTLRITAQPGDVVEVRSVLGVIVGDAA